MEHVNNTNTFWEGFVRESMRTNSTADKPNDINILHATMGLVGEVGEMLSLVKAMPGGGDFPGGALPSVRKQCQEKVLSEAGDVLWYCALLGTINPDENNFTEFMESQVGIYGAAKPITHSENEKDALLLKLLTEASISAAWLLDEYKKVFIYGHPMSNAFSARVRYAMTRATDAVKQTAYFYGSTPEEVANACIKKLKVRFPDKFTLEASLNRDYEKESEATGLASE